MDAVKEYDLLVADKVYRKCIDRGFEKYSEIAAILGKSESFVKAIFASHRKKLNLYHLVRLSYELKCSINDFLPNYNDYPNGKNKEDEYYYFLQSIEEDV